MIKKYFSELEDIEFESRLIELGIRKEKSFSDLSEEEKMEFMDIKE
jgi:hypothetical protein